MSAPKRIDRSSENGKDANRTQVERGYDQANQLFAQSGRAFSTSAEGRSYQASSDHARTPRSTSGRHDSYGEGSAQPSLHTFSVNPLPVPTPSLIRQSQQAGNTGYLNRSEQRQTRGIHSTTQGNLGLDAIDTALVDPALRHHHSSIDQSHKTTRRRTPGDSVRDTNSSVFEVAESANQPSRYVERTATHVRTPSSGDTTISQLPSGGDTTISQPLSDGDTISQAPSSPLELRSPTMFTPGRAEEAIFRLRYGHLKSRPKLTASPLSKSDSHQKTVTNQDKKSLHDPFTYQSNDSEISREAKKPRLGIFKPHEVGRDKRTKSRHGKGGQKRKQQKQENTSKKASQLGQTETGNFLQTSLVSKQRGQRSTHLPSQASSHPQAQVALTSAVPSDICNLEELLLPSPRHKLPAADTAIGEQPSPIIANNRYLPYPLTSAAPSSSADASTLEQGLDRTRGHSRNQANPGYGDSSELASHFTTIPNPVDQTPTGRLSDLSLPNPEHMFTVSGPNDADPLFDPTTNPLDNLNVTPRQHLSKGPLFPEAYNGGFECGEGVDEGASIQGTAWPLTDPEEMYSGMVLWED